jgi:transcriptional regulator with XRE-family HTH domain
LPIGKLPVAPYIVETMEQDLSATEVEAGLDQEVAEAVDDDQRLAAWIRAYRVRRGLTLAQLSELSGVSVGHLSRLENGTRTPTVRLLLQLARALGVSIGELVGESGEQSSVYVSRSEDRGVLEAGDGASLQSLADPALRALQAVELSLVPGRVGEPATHAGEEWIYVLSGAIELDLNGTVCALGADDAVHFRADVPHALRNPHDVGAKVLIVNSLESANLHFGY